ncbi:MAG: tannase/feruloyl esterase family alpha/beta hydrolase [Kiritimatiellae bacterium]|nr:tannase/feruloyl esterase family alpha/beta hydrolase [Kiritimatiellia bacterium]
MAKGASGPDWTVLLRDPGMGGCAVSASLSTAGDAGYRNPDGNPVDAPPGTVFAELSLSPAPGSEIRVEVALPPPERWCGRLVGIGNGGGGGWLPSRELGAHLRRGRATTTTDLGTKRDAARAGVGNPEVWKDFGHRATHLAMVAGRALAASLYGRPPRFVYFLGGSTGGQQGMMLAQRHPADCDAVIAAVPAHARTALHAYFLWNWRALHRADGSLLFTDAQERGWHEAALAAFAPGERLERARGRFVSDPRWTPALLEDALRRAAAGDPSLTPAHLDALRRLVGGPRHAVTGRRIHGGLPPGGPLAPSSGNLWIFGWVFGESFDPWRFDFGADFDRYEAALAPDLDAESADLDAFRARGGRMIVYSGTSDSCVPWHATAAWHDRVVARYGAEAARSFCRYYLLPGREHTGGPGVQTIRGEFDMLSRWREKGVDPAPVGHGMTPPAFDLPLRDGAP